MTLYRLTEEARADLFEAIDYIAADSEQAAIKWEQQMLKTFERLAQWPGSGRARREFTTLPLRFIVEGNYLILYDSSALPVTILAIFHSAQDVAQILAERFDSTSEK